MKRSAAPTNRPASTPSSRMEKPRPVIVAELAKQRRRIVSHQMLDRILRHSAEEAGID